MTKAGFCEGSMIVAGKFKVDKNQQVIFESFGLEPLEQGENQGAVKQESMGHSL